MCEVSAVLSERCLEVQMQEQCDEDTKEQIRSCDDLLAGVLEHPHEQRTRALTLPGTAI